MSLFKHLTVPGIIFAAALFFLPVPAGAASKSTLISRVERKSGAYVQNCWYSDFDGDGKKELFAEAGSDSTELWFSSDKETKYLEDVFSEYSYNEKKVNRVSRKQKIFIYELSAGGSGSTSLCYYVKSGRVKTVKKAGEGLTHVKGKRFKVYMSAFDAYSNGTGHTYKAYYLKWTGKKFKEYKGKKISQSVLKRYKNGAAVLRLARKHGYSIGNIFKRSNGVINVNLYRYDSYGDREQENLTLKIIGKRVKLVKVNKYYNSWIQKYSYGGAYKSRGF